MERRLLLVFALTFLVIALSQPLLKKYFPQQAAPSSPKVQPQPQAVQETNPSLPAQPQARPASPGATTHANAESEAVVENDLYRITFSNRGGQVKSWILKKYDDDKGQPLELLNRAAEKYGYPLSLWTYDEA